MLPRPDHIGELPKTRQVLLCGPCALATAPTCGVADRYESMRLFPPLTAQGVELIPSRYQFEGALFFAERWAAILTDDKGLGKTGQALLAIPPGVGAVVVCPASTKPGWVDEVKLWRPDLKPMALSGRSSWKGGPPAGWVYVLNYDILPRRDPMCRCNCRKDRHPNGAKLLARIEAGEVERDHIGGACLDCKCIRWRFNPSTTASIRDRLGLDGTTILIADEVHHVKRPTAEKTMRFRELRRACARAWGLSASPLENNEMELWGVYESLGLARPAFGTPKRFRRLFKEFKDHKRAPSGPSRTEIRERRSWVELGRTADQVGLELPPLRFEERRVVLTKADIARVEAILAEAMATKRAWDQVKAGKIEDPDTSPVARAAFDAMRRTLLVTAYAEQDIVDAIRDVMELGPRSKVGPEMSKLRKALAAAKLPAVIESFVQEVEDADAAAIVFAAHRIPIETIAGRPGWGEISGRITGDRRARTIRAFQAGKVRRLACTIRAAGEGLNLQRSGDKPCSLAAFIDLDWTPEKNNQAAKRIHRRGTTAACLVTHYVADHPIDRHVAGIINIKQRLIEAVSIQGGL